MTEWEGPFAELYERTYQVLLTAGCDDAQAKAIAKERVLQAAQRMIKPGDSPNIVVLL